MPLTPTVKLAGPALVTRTSAHVVRQTDVTIVEESLPLFDAGSPPPEIVAVLVTLGAAAAAGRTVSVIALALVPPAAITVALVQTMRVPPTTLSPAAGVFAVHVQPVPAAETNVRPAGRLSVTVYVPTVGALPSVLLTAIVYAPFTPTAKVEFAVLVICRSGLGVTVTLAWSSSPATLLPGVESGSALSAYETCAVLILAPTVVTLALIVRVALAPLFITPTSQMPVPEVYEPCDGTAEANVSPAGRRSSTRTSVLVVGPLLVTVTVKLTVVPGVRLLAVLVRLMSETRPGAVARSPNAGAPVALGSAVAASVVVLTWYSVALGEVTRRPLRSKAQPVMFAGRPVTAPSSVTTPAGVTV